ncbi:MAG: hypothetical protein RB296_01060 [Acidobacteriota bacterium]|jgi:hypothetical protein|nr:hypothetical protein [Acidobacteriota bacterium]
MGKTMQTMQEINLQVGEEVFLKKGMITQIRLVYAGMPGPDTFSMALIQTQGNNSQAFNLYWSRNTRQFRVLSREISVVDVSAQAIRFMIL